MLPNIFKRKNNLEENGPDEACTNYS